MLKAFDSQLEGHGGLRVFAEDAAAAKAEYLRLYALDASEGRDYVFSCVEVDPRTAPPVESPAWASRRALYGTIGTERKLTDEAKESPVQKPEAKPAPTVDTPSVPPSPQAPAAPKTPAK